MPSGNIALLTLTVAAAGALAANRFVEQDGSYPSAGGSAFGVTRSSAGAAGDLVPVDVLGTAVVELGADVAKDALVMANATGLAVPSTSGGKVTLGRALEAGVNGGFIEILLIPNGGFVTA